MSLLTLAPGETSVARIAMLLRQAVQYLNQLSFGNLLGTVSLTSQVAGILPIANGGTNDAGTAWATYSPTVTSLTGTITTVGAVSGRFKTIGKTVFVEFDITITTNGTGAAGVLVTLPVSAASNRYAMAGNQITGTPFSLIAATNPAVSVTQAILLKYDGTYPGANAAEFAVSGVYESA